MTDKKSEAAQCADELEHSIGLYGRADAFTLNAYSAVKMLRKLNAENEARRAAHAFAFEQLLQTIESGRDESEVPMSRMDQHRKS